MNEVLDKYLCTVNSFTIQDHLKKKSYLTDKYDTVSCKLGALDFLVYILCGDIELYNSKI